MDKNVKLLRSFVEYCTANPDMRFWQALRNWSKYNFVYGSHCRKAGENGGWHKHEDECLEDTYYFE